MVSTTKATDTAEEKVAITFFVVFKGDEGRRDAWTPVPEASLEAKKYDPYKEELLNLPIPAFEGEPIKMNFFRLKSWDAGHQMHIRAWVITLKRNH